MAYYRINNILVSGNTISSLTSGNMLIRPSGSGLVDINRLVIDQLLMSALPESTGINNTDLMMMVSNPTGSATTQKITGQTLRDTLLNQPAQLQFRQGTESERLLVTPATGEPIWITDTKKFYIGDGITVGGISIGDNSNYAALSGAVFSGSVLIPSGTGNFNNLTVNNISVSISGHTHTVSDITNFNSSVSGLVSGIYQPLLTSPVTGIGSVNKIPKWISASGLTDSIITENASVLQISGSIRGMSDDTYLSLDAASNRVGITKKNGFYSKFTYGSGAEFAISQSNATDILPTGTFTDRFVITSNGTIRLPGLTNNGFLKTGNSNGTLSVDSASYQPLLTNPVTGTGIINHIAYWNSSSGITADSEQLVWDSTNNRLGIGTSSPSGRLHVVGTGLFASVTGLVPNALLDVYSNVSGAMVFNVEGTNGSLFSVVDSLSGTLMSVNNNAGLPVLEVFSDDKIVGGRFNQNDFVITNSGNVGLGTASPSGKLHVIGTGIVSSKLGIGTNNPSELIHISGSTTDGAGIRFDNLTGNGGSIVAANNMLYVNSSIGTAFRVGNTKIRLGDGAAAGYIETSNGSISEDGNGGGLSFSGTTAQLSNGLNVTGGNVGVGTSTPSGQLHVVGTGIFSSRLGVGTTSPSTMIHASGSATGTGSMFRLQNTASSNNTYFDIKIGTPGNYDDYIFFARNGIDFFGAALDSTLYFPNDTRVASNKQIIADPNGNAFINLYNGSAQTDIGYIAGNALRFLNSYSEIARFDGTGKLGLGTTTPSGQLHVIGSGIFASGLNIANQTASTIASFDSNKNVVSLSTSTYPSLTELSYVKDVTSAIQTQLNSKQNSLTNPVTGTGVSNHIAYWNSSSGIVADSGQLYWDSTNNRLGIGTNAPISSLDTTGGVKIGGWSDEIPGSGKELVISSISSSSGTVNYSNAGIIFQHNGLNTVYIRSNPTNFRIGNNLGDAFTVSHSTNNIGIGTTTPSGKLHVVGTGIVSARLDVNNLRLEGNTLSSSSGNIIIEPSSSGSLQRDSGGNARGVYAVDWQTVRSSGAMVAGGDHSVIGGGSNNTATGPHSVVGGGYLNNASGSHSAIGGGETNNASGDRSVVSGGRGNTASGRYSFVGGGYNNTASGSTYGCSTVSGGRDNAAGDSVCTVSGGVHNTASGLYSSVGGGGYNTASSNSSTVGGGWDNTASGYYSTVGGGSYNNSSSYGSTVAGGRYNSSTTENYSTVGGGVFNTSSGFSSTVCGGQSNTTSGWYSSIGGGKSNNISSNYSTVCGGYDNTASGGQSTIVGGSSNTASGDSSAVGGGTANTASGPSSIVPGGFGAKATRNGEFSHSAGQFANYGDAQHTILIARRSTTDATANQVLFLDGDSNRLIIPAKTSWTFSVKLSAYNDTDNEGAWWIIRGGIRRNSSDGTALIGSLITENGSESSLNSASASVVADDTNEALEIRVTGVSGKSIRWTAVIDISQVSFGTP